jgi:phospholipid transport system substrate-binding protein
MGKTLAAWFLVSAAVASPTALPPRETVETAVGQVIAVLEKAQRGHGSADPTSRATGQRVRVEVRRIATDLFDFEEVSRRSLGRHWAGRTHDEQAQFLGLFADLLERAYVGRIEAYSGERIVYGNELVDGDYALVRSRILTKRRTETALDYRLHRVAGRWKVYDVLIDGVSFVSTYRSEFNRIIQAYSWDELMDRLRKKQIEARAVMDRS